jgi:predicted nucleotidyltransferase
VTKDKDIRACASELASRFHPDKIILFGSHAKGTAGPESDADLLVVMDHDERPPVVAARMRAALRTRFPVDIMVRSAAALRARLELSDPFFKDIQDNGLVLHEKAG